MRDYQISFARSARKELETLDRTVVNRIFARIESLADDPRPPGVIKLQGSVDLWRIRVGRYRILELTTVPEHSISWQLAIGKKSTDRNERPNGCEFEPTENGNHLEPDRAVASCTERLAAGNDCIGRELL